MGFVLRVVITAVALWVAALVVPGITVTGQGTWHEIGTLLLTGLIFGVVNALIKPVVKVVGCPVYVLTLGLFALVVNALLLLLVAWLANTLHIAFHVDGFWAAFWGAIIVGVVSWVLSLVVPGKH